VSDQSAGRSVVSRQTKAAKWQDVQIRKQKTEVVDKDVVGDGASKRQSIEGGLSQFESVAKSRGRTRGMLGVRPFHSSESFSFSDSSNTLCRRP
jgi:hypothetical protein